MVYRPTGRVLATLELLQVHGQMTGAELARRLEVDSRTVRKYIETLRDLGVPIEARRGRAGAYRLRSGTRLPPLMFSDDEAMALMLGLLIAQQSRLTDQIHLPAVVTKIERVLPETTRLRVEGVLTRTEVGSVPSKPAPLLQTVSILAAAARTGQRVRLAYCGAEGELTERDVDCYGVARCDEAWYSIGFCHLRQSQRLFRLDRVAAVALLDTTFTPPVGYSPLTEITASLAAVPRQWAVSVIITAPLDEAQSRIALSPGHFMPVSEFKTRIQVEVDDLRWMARVLAGSGLPFAIETPSELGEAIRIYAAELVAQV